MLDKELLEREAMLEELNRLKTLDIVLNDFESFVDRFLPHCRPNKSPEFHKQIYGLLGKNDPRTLIIAPRGFAKSTLSSRFLPLYMALTGKAKDIILVSATVSLAKEHVRMIRTELEYNKDIIDIFGLQTSDKWTEDHIILKNGTQIRAKGRGFQIRGFRPDVLICDDLEDEEVIYSKEQRDKMEAWFFRTLLPALKPQQKLIYIGTILHQYSLINKLRLKDEFKVLFFQALTDNKSIWEENFPTEYLIRLKSEMGLYAFEAEYQNNPMSLDEQPIKPHMLTVNKPIGEDVITVMTLDPAISEKELADYSAITIYSKNVDKDGNIMFRLVMKDKGHYGIDALVDKMIDLYKRYSPDRVLIEEFAFQKVIRPVLTKKAREQNIFIPTTTAVVGREVNGKTDKRPMDKVARLMQVLHLFEQKLVYIDDEEVRNELLSFPFGDHDDLVDSSVYGLYWLMKYQSGAAVSKSAGAKHTQEAEKNTLSYIEDKNGNLVAVHEIPKIRNKSNFLNIEK